MVRFLVGLIVGIVVGYGLGQLFGPRDGTPMTAFGTPVGSLRERPRHLADATQERIRQAVEEGRRAADVARAELEAKTLERDRDAEPWPQPTGKSPL